MEGGHVRTLSISLDVPAGEAYAFLSAPENFARWASWVGEAPRGPARVRFSEPNSYGVLDHSLTFPHGHSLYIPLRLVCLERGCQLTLTLSDGEFAVDPDCALRDLQAAKRLLEQNRGQSPILEKERP